MKKILNKMKYIREETKNEFRKNNLHLLLTSNCIDSNEFKKKHYGKICS